MTPSDYESGSLRADSSVNSTISVNIDGGVANADRMDNLEQVAHRIRNCVDCPLSGGRTNAVPGEGDPKAVVMFIGEGPGFQEDRQGRPFVGPAGKLLDSLLASINTSREDVFIANMVKCRPPENRDPAPTELAACTKYLDRQVELVDPKLIVTLGRFAFGRYFPGTLGSIAYAQLFCIFSIFVGGTSPNFANVNRSVRVADPATDGPVS